MAKAKARSAQPKIAARWLREAQGVVALGLAAYLGVALLSYDPALRWVDQEARVGIVGLWVGWALFTTVGYAAYLVPVVLMVWAFAAFTRPVAVGIFGCLGVLLAVLLLGLANDPNRPEPGIQAQVVDSKLPDRLDPDYGDGPGRGRHRHGPAPADLHAQPLHGLEHAHPSAAGAALGPQSGAAAGFAGLFVVFFPPHFLLDAAALDQLAKPAHGLLNGLSIANVQLDHKSSLSGARNGYRAR